MKKTKKRPTYKELVEKLMEDINEVRENQINILGNVKILIEEQKITQLCMLILLTFSFAALGVILALLLKLTLM